MVYPETPEPLKNNKINFIKQRVVIVLYYFVVVLYYSNVLKNIYKYVQFSCLNYSVKGDFMYVKQYGI